MHDVYSLSRRRFLGTSAAAAAAAAAGVAGVGATRAADVAASVSGCAAELARSIRLRRLTATQVVQHCLSRIEAMSTLPGAVTRLERERALTEAARCDAALSTGNSLGPLHGLPFTAADRFDTGQEATALARLHSAGAILLGHTRSGESRTPCGADIVAAEGSAFDLCAAFDFSPCTAASAAGLVALQTSHGRVSRAGMWPPPGGAFDIFAVTGLITRAVEDLPLILNVIGGEDAADFATAPVPAGDWRAVDASQLRIALWADPHEENTAVKRCAQEFASAGCVVVSVIPPRQRELSGLRARYLSADGGTHASTLRREPHGAARAVSGEVLPSAEFTRLCEELDAIRAAQLAMFGTHDLLLRPLPAGEPSNYLPMPGLPAGTAAIGGNGARAGGVELLAQPWREDVLIAALAFLERRGQARAGAT